MREDAVLDDVKYRLDDIELMKRVLIRKYFRHTNLDF